MKKYIFMLLASIMCLSSCIGDLDTMPLDDNQLVGQQVYSTKDGYLGVLAKCYGSLILTGQKGGDGGDGDLEGANEGYSGYVRLLLLYALRPLRWRALYRRDCGCEGYSRADDPQSHF